MGIRSSFKSLCSVVVFLWIVGLAAPASASPVTWEFEGEVTYFYDAANLFGGSVEVGTHYSGVFTFDSETPVSHSSSSSSTFQGAVTDIMVELGGHTVLGPTAGFNSISIVNDFFTSGFDNFGLNVSVMLGAEDLGFGLRLRDSDGTIFDSTTLPSMPPDINLLSPAGSGITLGTENQLLFVRGSITSVVPEPGTIFLFAIGGLLVGVRRRTTRCAANGANVRRHSHLLSGVGIAL